MRTVLGLLAGYAADAVFGDPRRGHPVAGFGRLAAVLEQRTYAPSRLAGAAHVGVLVGATIGAGVVVSRGFLPRGPKWLTVPVTAAATWAVLGGRSLQVEGEAMAGLLAADDLAGARTRIRNLVGRDPSQLSADELARACVESLAENTADAVVAPMFWGAVAGIPGLLGYRAINTLDAMIGHRSERYREFGWAAARLDDLANWLPARITVAATAVSTGSPAGIRHTYSVVRRDAGQHPSPNAGPVEAAFAATLGRSLGGSNTYDGIAQDRGRLGDGPRVGADDIAAAVQLHQRVALICGGIAVGIRAFSVLGDRCAQRRAR